MERLEPTRGARVEAEANDTHGRARREIAREILRYFMKHPDAKDTLEGIARWWLDRQRVERSVEEVAESLRLLVDHGLIVEQHGKAQRPYYQVNPAKRKEIGEFLEDDGGASNRTPTESQG